MEHKTGDSETDDVECVKMTNNGCVLIKNFALGRPSTECRKRFPLVLTIKS